MHETNILLTIRLTPAEWSAILNVLEINSDTKLIANKIENQLTKLPM